MNPKASLVGLGTRRAARWLLGAAIALILAGPCLAAELTDAQMANRRCFNCHGQSDIASYGPKVRLSMVDPNGVNPASRPAKRPGLFVDAKTLAGTVHESLACTDCHAGAKTLPHKANLPKARCNSTCHSKNQSDYLNGEHYQARIEGKKAPTCTTCHGGHDILPKENRNSRIYPLNIIKICGDCHEKHQGKEDNRKHVQAYLASVHGKALMEGGLVVSATCADCHGAHRVLPNTNPESTVSRANIAFTCGKCHVGLSEAYRTSIHGRQLAKGNENAPDCTNCHTAHAITRTNVPSFKLDIVNECGNCHDEPVPGSTRKTGLYETYRLSYHGQVTELGSTRAARCSDCHGSHNIRGLSDPGSPLSPQNRVATCRKCHSEATASFAKFDPHADFRDSTRYPVLHGAWIYFIIVMSGALGFFGLHTALWFMRQTIDRIRHGPHPRPPRKAVAIQRFSKLDRVNHALMITSFFGLTLTGLPLLYADQQWGRMLLKVFGGVAAAGLLHRLFAVLLFVDLIIHFAGLKKRLPKGRAFRAIIGPNTLLPRLKDLKDCVGMFRYFFRGGKRPDLERFAYWEKFDYLAAVGGSMIIGSAGLLLWFPQFFAKFMPGWVFNVAMLAHGHEAVLAILYLFTIHFFNAHLRVEKFPVDDVIFTGQLSEEEFCHDHKADYDRLVASGKLEDFRVPTAPTWWRKLAVMIGITAVLIGTILVVLILLVELKVM